MEIKATTGLIRPVGQVGQKPRNQRRQAAQHTPNQRRKALHKPPAGGATHHYLGRRQATHTPAQPVGGDIAPLSGSFAEEPRGEWTTVLDPSGDDSKARGSKQDRRHSLKKDIGIDILI